MIPSIRSLSELMAITESRNINSNLLKDKEIISQIVDNGQSQQYLKSINKEEVMLPNLPKIIKDKLLQNKKSVSRFIDDLDYNNQIQSSYNLTLLERQNKRNQQDVA